jgi:hypothetical protein
MVKGLYSSGLKGLKDRNWNSYLQDGENVNGLFTGSPSILRGVGGLVTSGAVSYNHGDAITMKFGTDGRLLVDTELTLSGTEINNVKVFSIDQSAGNSKYGLVDSDGHIYTNISQIGSTTVNVNGGVKDDGTQTITLAEDDPAVNDLSAISGLNANISSWTDGGIHTLPATHFNPQDFSASYTTSSTITVEGAPFTIDDDNCFISYIYYKPTGGNWTALINGANGISISASDNVITVSGETPFAADDEYQIGVNYQTKSYSSPTDSTQTINLNPESENYVTETLADVTNGDDGTYNYYLDMNGYKELGAQLILDGGTGSVFVTLKGTIQDDGTAPESCVYQDISSLYGETNWTDDSVLVDGDKIAGQFKYINFEVIADTGSPAANDADWTIYTKRLY